MCFQHNVQKSFHFFQSRISDNSDVPTIVSNPDTSFFDPFCSEKYETKILVFNPLYMGGCYTTSLVICS